jgi:hypothetical protein
VELVAGQLASGKATITMAQLGELLPSPLVN